MPKIHNPATGALSSDVPAALPALVRECARAARAARPGWAALPLARHAVLHGPSEFATLDGRVTRGAADA
jgi:acyl-CoA reductase-like NAD-dependent aldehyde dehydrogenase